MHRTTVKYSAHQDLSVFFTGIFGFQILRKTEKLWKSCGDLPSICCGDVEPPRSEYVVQA